MVLNKKKSSIVDFSNGVSKLKTSEISGIKVTDSYKYLGTIFDRKLSIHSHLKSLNKKVGFLMYRLFPIRKHASPKLLVNLFKVYIYPQYMMIKTLFNISKKKDK